MCYAELVIQSNALSIPQYNYFKEFKNKNSQKELTTKP
jgi:hypothetical protein